MVKKSKFLCAALVLLWIGTLWAQDEPVAKPQQSSSEQVVAQIDFSSFNKTSFKVSPDNRHIAYAAKAGRKQVVYTDMTKGKEFDSVSAPVFSPDSKRVAYAAMTGEKWCMVVDGIEGKQYDSIKAAALMFSPDSKRIAYAASAKKCWFVVLDGEEGKYCAGVYDLLFSPDSKHFAYWLEWDSYGGPFGCTVIDGKWGAHFDRMHDFIPDVNLFDARITFSPDSKRIVYNASEGQKWSVIVDGKTQSHCRVYDFVFSGDSKHLAYSTSDGVVVEDGKAGERYDSFEGSLVYSPDSKHLAYAAQTDRGRRQVFVVDGKEGTPYIKIWPETLVFSPDGGHMAYAAARSAGKICMVLDGKEVKEYDGIIPGTLCFSPDGTRMAYGVLAGKKQHMIVDGKEDKEYESIYSSDFSQDGKHFAYTAKAGNKCIIVLDGKEEFRYDGILILGGGIFKFESPESLLYLAFKGNNVYLIENKMQ